MEIVSEDNREHDLVTKRAECAEAGIPEYWIMDPREQRIRLLRLTPEGYSEGVFPPGQNVTSALLPDFRIDVTTAFAAAH